MTIPAGEHIIVMEGAPAEPGSVRIQGSGYGKGILGMYVTEADLESCTERA